MRKALGTVFKNEAGRFHARLEIGAPDNEPVLLEVRARKNMKDAIQEANKLAELLGWEVDCASYKTLDHGIEPDKKRTEEIKNCSNCFYAHWLTDFLGKCFYPLPAVITNRWIRRSSFNGDVGHSVGGMVDEGVISSAGCDCWKQRG